MIPEIGLYYIGDLSKNDALVLKEMAETHTNILEFGVGASTQILTKCKNFDDILISIDTSSEWLEKTRKNLEIFGMSFYRDRVHFREYDKFLEKEVFEKHYDFIFDDGVDNLRREFAIKIWPHLEIGGILAFHDTRRGHDFRNVLEVLATFMDEIEKVEFNYKNSNITLVYKKAPQPYVNWQIEEDRQGWMLGYSEPPQEFINQMNKTNESN